MTQSLSTLSDKEMQLRKQFHVAQSLVTSQPVLKPRRTQPVILTLGKKFIMSWSVRELQEPRTENVPTKRWLKPLKPIVMLMDLDGLKRKSSKMLIKLIQQYCTSDTEEDKCGEPEKKTATSVRTTDSEPQPAGSLIPKVKYMMTQP